MRRLHGALLATAALAACSDPSLAIDIRYEDPALQDQLRSLTLAVVELPAHADGSPVACDEVRYGRVSRDSLDGGRRASASAGDGSAGLTGVPRLGEKLVILEGRDAAGARIAGGCAALGDIEADTRVEVTAEIVPRVRIIGADGAVRDPSDPPATFAVGLLQPWREDGRVVGLGGRRVDVDLRDRAADRETIASATSCGDGGPACATGATTGLATVPLSLIKDGLTPPIVPGPVEVIVRAPWIEEPLVARAFEPIPVVPGSEVFLAPVGLQRTPNQAAPSWAFVKGTGLRAAALYVSGGDTRAYRIVLIENRVGTPVLTRRDILVGEPVFSLVAWDGDFWTRTASGWRKVNFNTSTLAPAVGGAGEAATEMFAIEPCDGGAEPKGLLVRAGDGPYVAYDAPAVPHVGTGDQLAALTSIVNLFDSGRVLGTLCLTYPTVGTRRTVVVRGEATGAGSSRVGTYLVYSAPPPGPLLSPVASGFLGYPGGGTWRLAGATLDVTGPRLTSYTLTGDQLLGGEDGRLDGELTTLPTSTAVADLDDDGELDLVATAHEIVGESRIQVTYLAHDGRAPLTGLSPPFRGVAPLVAVEKRNGTWVAAVATSDRLSIFDLEAP